MQAHGMRGKGRPFIMMVREAIPSVGKSGRLLAIPQYTRKQIVGKKWGRDVNLKALPQ